jgi:hypothetical protein
MLLAGDMILCSRSDDPEARQFDGELAYLSLWDDALTEGQVKALYDAVAPKLASSTGVADSGAGQEILNSRATNTSVVRTVSGRECMFPFVYNGRLVTECVDLSGTPSCQVRGCLIVTS